LEIDPTFLYSIIGKGISLANQGNDTGAITYYDRALAINPNDVNALANKASALFDFGSYDEAIKYYDEALAIKPNDIFSCIVGTNKEKQ
jgi:tetratricopeptide (TPR) repeat protein